MGKRDGWLVLGLLGVGWLGMAVGAEPDPEAVRRLMEKYEREAAEEAAKKAPAPKPQSKPKPAPTVNYDHEAWKSAERCGTAACFEAYLAEYPKGRYARMARARLKPVAAPPTPAPTPPVAAPAAPSRSSLEPEMVRIPTGCFQMGSPGSETDRESDERQHRVCVDSFEMGRYEVTQRQWQAVIGSNPSFFKNCSDCPVEQVSWDDVQNYLRKLNQQTGKKYRLPTEAEWEYACRGGAAGQTYCGGDNPDRLAWHGNILSGTHPVGQKAANGFGLYDMSGNVWEWTCSAYDENYGDAEKHCTNNSTTGRLAMRGGSSHDTPAWVRSAYRTWFDPANRFNGLGFRLARSL